MLELSERESYYRPLLLNRSNCVRAFYYIFNFSYFNPTFFFPALTTRLLGPYDAFFMEEGSAECINGSRNI